ncbi:unnamed protein product [Orchesella dallaii]|uniref:F-box domain-containing protein n=1 Tax=Orchesella dallaii TaxID=48710 RepID=A0ABP1R333_9HEXA
MGRQNPMKQDDAFKYIPPELCFEIFSYLDIESFRAIRRVSKRIKILADASRNLSFNCDLTDTTIATIVHSTESFSRVKVHNFGGEKNKIVSSTRGTGRVFGCAQAIHLIGSNINAVEIGKMMQYAVGSVNELIFQHCSSAVLTSVFDLQKTFESLRRLSICHNYFPSRQETQILENIGSENVALQLPHLEVFKISYELVNIAYGFLSPNDVFANYLAVAQLIHRYKETLRTVEILRNEMLLAPFLFLFFSDVRLSRYQRDQMQKCVEGFNETKLDSLTIVTLLKEGTYPWTLG